MTTTQPTGNPVRMTARCATEPVPFGVDIDDSAIWHMERGDGYEESTAGLAEISFDSCGVSATFDYLRPSELVQVSLTAAALRNVADGGRSSSLVRALVGEVHGLESVVHGEHPTTHFVVQDTSNWLDLGRVAVMQTMLSRHARPFDGLWAGEAAVTLWNVDRQQGLVGATWADVAAPALEAVPLAWTEVLDETTLAALDRMIAVIRELGSSVDGPFARSRDHVAADALEASIAELEPLPPDVRTESPYVGALVGVGAASDPDLLELPSFRGQLASDNVLPHFRSRGRPSATVVFDHSIPRGLLDSGRVSAELESDVLALQIGVVNTAMPQPVVERCLVSIVDPAGQLLAGSISLSYADDSLEGSYRLPPGSTSGGVTVVVHRDPAFWPGMNGSTTRRLRQRYAQDLVDAGRRKEQATWVEDLDSSLRPDRALAASGSDRMYLAERLAADGLTVSFQAGGSARHLEGLRALAMSIDLFDVAAEAELARLAQGSDTTLGLTELDALILRASPALAHELAAVIGQRNDIR